MTKCSRIESVPLSGKLGDFTNQQKPPQEQQIVHGRTNVGMAFDRLFQQSVKQIKENEKNNRR